MATLKDYQNDGVPEPDRFYEMNKGLSAEAYRMKIIETYGPSGREAKMEAMVNAAVLRYVMKKGQYQTRLEL